MRRRLLPDQKEDLEMTFQTFVDDGKPESASIRPAFALFTERLARDLAMVDGLLESHRPVESDRGVEAFARDAFPTFARWLDDRLVELEDVFAAVPSSERERHGAFFREALWPFTRRSAFLKRTNERPRGYAGDSEMMRMLYDEGFVGTSVLGCLLHHHPVQSAAAKAVRNRIALLSSLLDVDGRDRKEPLRILSLACGPARELRHVVRTASVAERVTFLLVDQDTAALAEAEDEIRHVTSTLGAELQAPTRRLSVSELLERGGGFLGSFDAIYSLGLFDYLAQATAERLASVLVSLLRPGGALIVGNFHVDCATRTYLDVWMDWPLVYRTSGQMLDLVRNVTAPISNTVEFEPTRSQMFLRVRRRPAR